MVVLFLLKNTSIFENSIIFKQENSAKNGLTYNDATIEDLVNRDTDIDGIPDWQESLYGLDPTKKETTPGTPDSTALNKLRAVQGNDATTENGGNSSVEVESLTQTEKFSRELFATVAATSQNGNMDQATIEALSASLAEKIQNPTVRKTFLISDIKISTKDDINAITNYVNDLSSIKKKYPSIKYTVLDVMQEFLKDENNINANVLVKLDPIIEQTNNVISSMMKMNVPKSLSISHLNIINSLQRLSENLSDIKLFDTDPIVSFGAFSQYNQNTTALVSNTTNLQNIIKEKLNN